MSGTPSVLNGSIEEIIQEANGYIEKGVFGFDLLSYRYSGDANHLNAAFTSQVSAPICIAGSIDSYEKIDRVKTFSPWAFTIGGAFFEKKFGETYAEQIDNVCKYIGAGTEIIDASKIQED